MRSKDLKDMAHNQALNLLDGLIYDYRLNHADIRMFADHLRHELIEIKNYITVRKWQRPKKSKK